MLSSSELKTDGSRTDTYLPASSALAVFMTKPYKQPRLAGISGQTARDTKKRHPSAGWHGALRRYVLISAGIGLSSLAIAIAVVTFVILGVASKPAAQSSFVVTGVSFESVWILNLSADHTAVLDPAMTGIFGELPLLPTGEPVPEARSSKAVPSPSVTAAKEAEPKAKPSKTSAPKAATPVAATPIAATPQPSPRKASPPAAPILPAAERFAVGQTVENVNLTFYDCLSQGFCGHMYGGKIVYEGAAACSWNLAIGTHFVIVGDPTGRVYVCEDRGLLADTWVDIFWHDPADGWIWQARIGRLGTIQILVAP